MGGADRRELQQIVHDLKSPLSTIELELAIIAERRGDDPELLPLIGRIRRNVLFLDRLVYNLVDACAIANGQFALSRARRDLARTVANVVDRVVPTRDRHRVALGSSRSIVAMIDEIRIERVIANLLDNALKYTPRESAITVSLSSTSRHAEIAVTDTGPGLSRDELSTIFDPYRRGATSRDRRGCGLGLHISKQIVEAHHGRIGVECVREVGTRFYFTLPIVAADVTC
jgi:two-component system sensor histidine kinase ResE